MLIYVYTCCKMKESRRTFVTVREGYPAVLSRPYSACMEVICTSQMVI